MRDSFSFKDITIAGGYETLDGTWLETEPTVAETLAALLSDVPKGQFLTTLAVAANQKSVLALPFNTDACVALCDESGNVLTMLTAAEMGKWVLPPLAMGYYQLTAGEACVFLVVAPTTTYAHPDLSSGRCLSGCSIQLYSLRSARNWGIGDLGDLEEALCHFANRHVDFIGINPLHALFDAHPVGASPYSPSSRCWFNPIYLDVDSIAAFQASTAAQAWWQNRETQAWVAAVRAAQWVDYPRVWQLKDTALRLAWETFRDAPSFAAERAAFAAFCAEQGQSLREYALFQTLDRYFASVSGWQGWPAAYQHPDSDAVALFAKQHHDALQYQCWLQWLLDTRLQSIQAYAHSLGMRLGLYGDMAVGSARGSADVWSGRHDYVLHASIGAPPDAFTPLGQNWQLPPLNPRVLHETGCLAFRQVLRANMRHYGVLRIDHVMALYRLWWVAFGEGAVHGAYVHYPVEILMAVLALESTLARCVVIGEDLGIVPPQIRTLLDAYGVYTYKVMYFEQDCQPDAYPTHSLATLGTHDLPPLAGYLAHTDLDALHRLDILDEAAYIESVDRRKHHARELARVDDIQDTHSPIMALHTQLMQQLAIGRAQLVSVQLENIFGIDESCNLPGVADAYPNWRLRMPDAVNTLDDRDLWQIVYAARRTTEEITMKRMILSDAESTHLEETFNASLRDAFAWFGVHQCREGAIVRVLAPHADGVQLIHGGQPYPLQQIDDRGLFIGYLPYWTDDYRLAVCHDGSWSERDDPYRFPSALSEYDLWLLGEGAHLRPYEQLGAHPITHCGVDGVRFAVWAPNARRVSVVGDFNGWDGRLHVMRFHQGCGVWEIFIPDIARGAKYKFELLDAQGQVRLKADPYAFAAELRPDTASVVQGLPAKVAVPPERANANQRTAAMSIYEVHIGSWRRHTEQNTWLNYDELADELIPYVQRMGFTHIELLPVSEFPFDGSWGYQTTGLYAPTARFGQPDGLRRFIERAHDVGIGVLLDWVVGHFPTDDYALARFDGTALYEHADPREGYHHDWNTYIYNFGRHEVGNFLVGNALYWIERFGFDGLRVDAVASMLYRDYSRRDGEWIPNQYGGRENIEALAFLRRTNGILRAECPHAVVIAEESTSFPGVTHALEEGGVGFTYKWNMGWMNDTLDYMQKAPIYRRYHHNLMTFAMAYQHSESFILPLSHDEVVHGKRSLLGKMPGDCWQQFANLRAYYGFMWAHPGKKLLFMGGEFAQGREWNEDSSLDWHLLGEEYGPWHRGVQRWVADLNTVYRDYAALHATDDIPNGFCWRVVDDTEQSVFAFERIAGEERVLIVSNMTPVVRYHYRIGVGVAGQWREILNSDAGYYGGSGVGNASQGTETVSAHGCHCSLELILPPLATIFLLYEPSKH